MLVQCEQCVFRHSCGQSIKECRKHHGGEIDKSATSAEYNLSRENVTQLLRHFPFSTHVFVYSLGAGAIFSDIKMRLSQCTDSWKRQPVNEWEFNEDGIHIWID